MMFMEMYTINMYTNAYVMGLGCKKFVYCKLKNISLILLLEVLSDQYFLVVAGLSAQSLCVVYLTRKV